MTHYIVVRTQFELTGDERHGLCSDNSGRALLTSNPLEAAARAKELGALWLDSHYSVMPLELA